MNDNSHDGKLARIEDRLDRPIAGAIAVRRGGSVEFRSMAEVMEMAKMMAIAQQAVPKHLRGNPGLCLGVIMQSVAWEMEPFAVARMSFVVNDMLGYLSQLIHAVIEARAPLRKRLRCTYSGEGQERQCTVSGTFVGEDTPHEYTTPKFKDILVKNSPLWKGDVDQQLFYYASRSWARKWCPDVLLGVYSPDEAQYAGENAAPVRTVIHNPLEDEADDERPARGYPGGTAGDTDTDRPGGRLTEPDSDDGAVVHVDGTVTRPGDRNHSTEAEFRNMTMMDHDPETGEVFDAKVDSERRDAEDVPEPAFPTTPVRASMPLPSRVHAEAVPDQLPTKIDGRAIGVPAEPPKTTTPRARPRPTPRQARTEPAGEPKAAAAPKGAPADKTHPEANAALGIAFPQPWIRKTAAEYEAYLQKWVAAWLAYGKDPDGLRNRYSAERTIRSGLGEPADHDTLSRWKNIAAEVFKKLGGQS